MKRTQRNLVIYAASIAALFFSLRRLPDDVQPWIGPTLLVLALGLAIWARDFMVGRYAMRRRDWHRALEHFQRFEGTLRAGPWSAFRVAIFGGFYTFDGIALTRNNIAVVHMNLGQLDEAERWLQLALARDAHYALAYVNLGTLAAMRKNEAEARRNFDRAVQLGYSATGAQLLLRRILARGNSAAGQLLQ